MKDQVSPFYIRKASDPDKVAQLGEKALAQMVLRYWGDDGLTVAGTAEAIAAHQRLRALKPGEWMAAGKSGFDIGRVAQ